MSPKFYCYLQPHHTLSPSVISSFAHPTLAFVWPIHQCCRHCPVHRCRVVCLASPRWSPPVLLQLGWCFVGGIFEGMSFEDLLSSMQEWASRDSSWRSRWSPWPPDTLWSETSFDMISTRRVPFRAMSKCSEEEDGNEQDSEDNKKN